MGVTVPFFQLRPLIDRIQWKLIRVCFHSNVLCISVSMPNQKKNSYSTHIHRCFSSINWKYKVLECQIVYAVFYYNCIEPPQVQWNLNYLLSSVQCSVVRSVHRQTAHVHISCTMFNPSTSFCVDFETS